MANLVRVPKKTPPYYILINGEWISGFSNGAMGSIGWNQHSGGTWLIGSTGGSTTHADFPVSPNIDVSKYNRMHIDYTSCQCEFVIRNSAASATVIYDQRIDTYSAGSIEVNISSISTLGLYPRVVNSISADWGANIGIKNIYFYNV